MRRMHPASYDRHVRAPRSGLPFRRLFNQALFGRIGGVLFLQRGLLRLAWLFAASALAFRRLGFLRLCDACLVPPGNWTSVVMGKRDLCSVVLCGCSISRTKD